MIVSMASKECGGKLKYSKKVKTIVIVDDFEEYKRNYNNIMMNDAVIYKGDIEEFVDCVTPENAKQVFLFLSANPDILNLSSIDKIKDYNVLCNVPANYSNMEQLYNLSQMYPNIRFCGGELVLLKGVNIGVFDTEKPKKFVFNDPYSCQEPVTDISEIEGYTFVQTNNGVQTVKVKATKPKDTKTKAEKRTTSGKKKNTFKTGGLSMF